MNKRPYQLSQINSFGEVEFVHAIGPAFEHSPWIAEGAWSRRPFASLQHLHQVLCEIVSHSGKSKQIELIRAHPDLVGRAAEQGSLTPASAQEQASAELDRLSPQEVTAFQEYNRNYRGRFGFPFVICARLNKKEAILHGFQTRLKNSREKEIQTALGEIGKIAWLRLKDWVSENSTTELRG